MFVFQWNSMRVGEHVMVHDDLDAGFALSPGIVKYVETVGHSSNDVAIRVDGQTSPTHAPAATRGPHVAPRQAILVLAL